MEQEFTSKETSINKTKLPSIYKLHLQNMSILDYGCGRYTDHIKEFVSQNNCTWLGYDKYNQTVANNKKALATKSDVVVCANVLNVIKEDEIILEIVRDCLKHTKTVAYFSVYVGNKTGVGKRTKKDCYQRNQKPKAYIEMLKAHGFKAEKCKGGFIKVGL